MRHLPLALGILLAALTTGALGGCDQAYDPDAPAVDPNAPRVHITSPARGTFSGDVGTVQVTGTAFDDQGVTAVTVNGVTASLAEDGTFTATVPVRPGTNLLHAIARDAQANQGKETRAVVAGGLEPIETVIQQGLTASLTAQAIDAIGRGITGFMTGPTLMSAVAPMNPVIDVGTEMGAPDCLYVTGAIDNVTMSSTSKIKLMPQWGGIYLDATLERPNVDIGLQYAVSCLDGGRTVSVGATRIRITGVLKMSVAGGKFEIYLDDEDVQITGFNVDLGGVPGAIVDMLRLDTAMGPILAFMVEALAVPYVNQALDGLNQTTTVDVLGTAVDIRVRPARIDVDIPGAIIELDTELRAHGDTSSPGFVFTPNIVPTMDLTRGFELAVADDAANQLLGSYWAAKGMDTGIDLANGSYGAIGKLYDRVELTAMVPPFIDASGDGLRLTVGDLMGTFKLDGVIATQVAINAELALEVVAGAAGALRLDVGDPVIHVDVLDEAFDSTSIEGSNQLSNAQFEAVSSFALSRILAFGSGAVGAIPLPAFGGVAVSDVDVVDADGYLIVGGEIQ